MPWIKIKDKLPPHGKEPWLVLMKTDVGKDPTMKQLHWSELLGVFYGRNRRSIMYVILPDEVDSWYEAISKKKLILKLRI